MDECVAETERQITFVSPTKSVSVNYNYAILSKVVRAAFDSDPTGTEFPVSFKDDVLNEIVYYLNHCKGVPREEIKTPCYGDLGDNVSDKVVVAWLEDMWRQDKQRHLSLLEAVHYLDINCLFHIQCCHVGLMLQNASLEDMPDLNKK